MTVKLKSEGLIIPLAQLVPCLQADPSTLGHLFLPNKKEKKN